MMESCYAVLNIAEDSDQENIDHAFFTKSHTVESNCERRDLFQAYMLATELRMYQQYNFDVQLRDVHSFRIQDE